MNWDYMLDPPEDFDEDYVDGDEDWDYYEHQDIDNEFGFDYRSDEYERIINQNY